MCDPHRVRILTVGVFDLLHHGHLRVFQQAKEIAPNGYLIVAVQESDYIRKFKPEADVFFSTDVRCELIQQLRCVDEVITYSEVDQIVQTVDFDIFAVGEDQNHQGFCRAIDYCNMKGIKIFRMKRTPNVSSRMIKSQM